MTTRGFTLVELMVSVALFGLVASGSMTLVLAGARSQAYSARVDGAQTALRVGIDFITRDVMMASAGAAAGVVTIPGGAVVNTVRFDVAANDSTSGPDTLELWLVDGAPAAQLASPVAAGATTLPIAYEQSATSTFAATIAPFHSYVQLCDTSFTTAVVTTLDAVNGNTLTVGALPGASGFGANAWVLPSKHVVYSVGSPFAGTSMLMMSINGVAQPLAEGVEDLQVAYGFDTDGDGLLTDAGSTSDEWLYNNAADSPAGFAIAQLRAVRVTLTAAAVGEKNVRRVLRTEIAVRNFNR
jgi:prepilin-type N-terminal cleavage/methylation domain-containing protein